MNLGYLITSLCAGLVGLVAMEAVMWLTTRAGPAARGSMIVALGALITGSRERAFRVGLTVHTIVGLAFAALYVWGLRALGLTHFPTVLLAGVGFGMVHGMIVSLMLVWVVSDHHPLEEFQEADLAIGLSHFVGHAAYGAAIGFVVGLASHAH